MKRKKKNIYIYTWCTLIIINLLVFAKEGSGWQGAPPNFRRYIRPGAGVQNLAISSKKKLGEGATTVERLG